MKFGKGEINEENGELSLSLGGRTWKPTDEMQPGITAAQFVAKALNSGMIERCDITERFCASVRVFGTGIDS